MKNSLGILPDMHGYTSVARCLMFYDWEHKIGPEWLDLVEELFAEFDLIPCEGQGVIEDEEARGGYRRSNGNYKRVRKRLRAFLQEGTSYIAGPSISIQSEPWVMKETFFPCDMRISLSAMTSSGPHCTVAVRETIIENCEELVNRVGMRLFTAFDIVYGGAWNFPTAFGPNYYTDSIGVVPRGVKSTANRTYTNRITQWRNHRWHGLSHTQGFLREVYGINFVLDAHLNAPFRGKPLSDFMRSIGELGPSGLHNGVYRWDVPENRLDDVRQQLETSGLILSSATEPLQALIETS